MKLELKYLAPYLPYKIKCELLNYKSDYVGEKYGIINGFYYLGSEVHYTFKDRSTAGKTRDLIKPILRPLSDLTKDEVFYETFYTDFSNEDNVGYICEGKGDISTQGLSYTCINFLIENHFDVFGLIEQGLAIDINTI